MFWEISEIDDSISETPCDAFSTLADTSLPPSETCWSDLRFVEYCPATLRQALQPFGTGRRLGWLGFRRLGMFLGVDLRTFEPPRHFAKLIFGLYLESLFEVGFALRDVFNPGHHTEDGTQHALGQEPEDGTADHQDAETKCECNLPTRSFCRVDCFKAHCYKGLPHNLTLSGLNWRCSSYIIVVAAGLAFLALLKAQVRCQIRLEV